MLHVQFKEIGFQFEDFLFRQDFQHAEEDEDRVLRRLDTDLDDLVLEEPDEETEPAIAHLMLMGFQRRQAREALQASNGVLRDAVVQLLNNN
mmetsp:Transcript_16518/g.20412  ORF Transcript_16518/g.20412 Transcript_16518/m.20412 type:complete len:92 (-) Transcript_16518:165-440(-)